MCVCMMCMLYISLYRNLQSVSLKSQSQQSFNQSAIAMSVPIGGAEKCAIYLTRNFTVTSFNFSSFTLAFEHSEHYKNFTARLSLQFGCNYVRTEAPLQEQRERERELLTFYEPQSMRMALGNGKCLCSSSST